MWNIVPAQVYALDIFAGYSDKSPATASMLRLYWIIRLAHLHDSGLQTEAPRYVT